MVPWDCRQELISGSEQRQPGKETEVTAELDNKGLVQLQQQVMQQQDRELEQMEKTVVSTKVGYCMLLHHDDCPPSRSTALAAAHNSSDSGGSMQAFSAYTGRISTGVGLMTVVGYCGGELQR